MPRGRPRIPLEKLRLVGSFRTNEHGDRLNEPQASGEPVKPHGMSREASAEWNRLVPLLLAMRTVKEIDTQAVVAACEMWALYRKAFRQAMKYPTDKDVRGAVVAYLASWDKAASKLGMNPVDRAKLSVPPEAKKDGIEAFARKRG